MTDIIILTSSPKGSIVTHLEELVNSSNINIKAVILNENLTTQKKTYYKRKMKKVFKIGVLGSLNGIRMRKWYSQDVLKYTSKDTLKNICIKNDIPLCTTPTINCQKTIDYFREFGADVGLSLGNGYIGRKVFSIPRNGMINIHHELLPDYQNAQSIIWQLYNNSRMMGYTIHKINKFIDKGEIIYSKQLEIVVRENLGDTIAYNYASLWRSSAKGLVTILEDFENYYSNGKEQGKGGNYTTPSIWQFLRIRSNFYRLKYDNGE